MGWFASVLTGFLTAAVAAVSSGYVADAAVRWYDISWREAGYFVVVVSFWGFVVGLIIGIVSARFVGARTGLGFLKGSGVALAIVLTIVGVGAGVSRSLADIPPEIDGESLFLIVEVRLPTGETQSPTAEPGDSYLQLGAIASGSNRVRKHVPGPLWKEDAKLVDGRWIVPGVVEVFTTRGRRLLTIVLGSQRRESFIVPLPSKPRQAQKLWSEWLPRPRPDGLPPVNQLSYRFRVQSRSEPIRFESVGPFEIATIAGGFYESGDHIASNPYFRIRYRGQPYAIGGKETRTGNNTESDERVVSVTTFASPQPALLASVQQSDGHTPVYLLSEADGQPKAELVAQYNSIVELTVHPPQPRSTGQRPNARQIFQRRGLLLVGGSAVVDTRRLAVHHFTDLSEFSLINSVPLLGVSPDERSLVRYAYAGSAEGPVLVVTDFVADQSYTLPIDRQRMRYVRLNQITPAWLAHHFAWERDAQGSDRLVERQHFTPLAYHGEVQHVEQKYYVYRIDGVSEPMREAVIDFLVAQLNAERLPARPDAYRHELSIDGQKVYVDCSTDFHFVQVEMDYDVDSSLVVKIAERFNAELATGKHDALVQK